METVKMGKRGTVVIPAKLRKQFGLDDGSLLVTEVRDGEIRLRPAVVYEQETWSPATRAYYILINSATKEEWDRNLPDVLALGVDPVKIDGIEPGHRETLPSQAEWKDWLIQRQAELVEAEPRA